MHLDPVDHVPAEIAPARRAYRIAPVLRVAVPEDRQALPCLLLEERGCLEVAGHQVVTVGEGLAELAAGARIISLVNRTVVEQIPVLQIIVAAIEVFVRKALRRQIVVDIVQFRILGAEESAVERLASWQQ